MGLIHRRRSPSLTSTSPSPTPPLPSPSPSRFQVHPAPSPSPALPSFRPPLWSLRLRPSPSRLSPRPYSWRPPLSLFPSQPHSLWPLWPSRQRSLWLPGRPSTPSLLPYLRALRRFPSQSTPSLLCDFQLLQDCMSSINPNNFLLMNLTHYQPETPSLITSEVFLAASPAWFAFSTYSYRSQHKQHDRGRWSTRT